MRTAVDAESLPSRGPTRKPISRKAELLEDRLAEVGANEVSHPSSFALSNVLRSASRGPKPAPLRIWNGSFQEAPRPGSGVAISTQLSPKIEVGYSRDSQIPIVQGILDADLDIVWVALVENSAACAASSRLHRPVAPGCLFCLAHRVSGPTQENPVLEEVFALDPGYSLRVSRSSDL